MTAPPCALSLGRVFRQVVIIFRAGSSRYKSPEAASTDSDSANQNRDDAQPLSLAALDAAIPGIDGAIYISRRIDYQFTNAIVAPS